MRFVIFVLCQVFIYLSNYCANVVASELAPDPRIYGGHPAGANEFPWHVYIIATGMWNSSTCGGSILSETWVLTAAHCTLGFNKSIDLYFGSTDVYSMPIILSAKNRIEHEGYIASNKNNDIAVVQLEAALNFTPSIQPIKLISQSESRNEFVNEVATVMGFGYTLDKSDPNAQESSNLLHTKVVIISNANCTEYFGTEIVTEKVMCAVGYASRNHSVCYADSGGAMVITNANNEYIQIGISSFVSNSGCTKGLPSGYVRVGLYLDWISSQTGIQLPA